MAADDTVNSNTDDAPVDVENNVCNNKVDADDNVLTDNDSTDSDDDLSQDRDADFDNADDCLPASADRRPTCPTVNPRHRLADTGPGGPRISRRQSSRRSGSRVFRSMRQAMPTRSPER